MSWTVILGLLVASAVSAVVVYWLMAFRLSRANKALKKAPFGLLTQRVSGAYKGWVPNDAARTLLALSEGFALLKVPTLLQRFLAEDHEELNGYLDALLAEGTEFQCTFEVMPQPYEGRSLSSSPTALTMIGRRHRDTAQIWIADATAPATLAERYVAKTQETERLRHILEALPIPIWWRKGGEMEIDGQNAASRSAFQTADGLAKPGSPISPAGSAYRSTSLAHLAQRTGLSQSESSTLIRDGERRAIEIIETPIKGYGPMTVGYARDVTALENTQMTLAEHVAAQDELLERMTSAIAIFGPDRHLKYYNRAYHMMFRLDTDFMDRQPTLSQVIERRRESRVAMEVSDWAAYKRERESWFTDLIDPKEYMTYLPDGRALRTVVAPHPLGGLIFQYDDVTDRITLESQYNTVVAVQRSTLDVLFESVSVFGRDGRLKLFNQVFATTFGLDIEWLETGPHISEIIDSSQALFVHEGPWQSYRERMIYRISEPRSEQGRLSLTDGRVFEYAYVPLPDAQCLMLHFDVTDSTKVEAALRDRNAALERADQIKNQFLSSVSYEFRTPLNVIMGFTELMKMDAVGALSDRQQGYVDNIFFAAGILSDLVANVLDLASLEAELLEFDLEHVELLTCVEQAIANLPGSEGRRAEVTILEPVGDQGLAKQIVSADRRRLVQALRLLIGEIALFVQAGTDPVSIELVSDQTTPTVVIFLPGPSLKIRTLITEILGSDQAVEDGAKRATGREIAISLARALLSGMGAELTLGARQGTLMVRFEGPISKF